MKQISSKIQLFNVAQRIGRQLRERLDFNTGYKIHVSVINMSASIYVYANDGYITSSAVEAVQGVVKPWPKAYGIQIFYGVSYYEEKQQACVSVGIIRNK